MDQVVPELQTADSAEEIQGIFLRSWVLTQERRAGMLQVVPNWTGEEIEIESETESEIFWQNGSD